MQINRVYNPKRRTSYWPLYMTFRKRRYMFFAAVETKADAEKWAKIAKEYRWAIIAKTDQRLRISPKMRIGLMAPKKSNEKQLVFGKYAVYQMIIPKRKRG